jgi:hypothetical protein
VAAVATTQCASNTVHPNSGIEDYLVDMILLPLYSCSARFDYRLCRCREVRLDALNSGRQQRSIAADVASPDPTSWAVESSLGLLFRAMTRHHFGAGSPISSL